MSSFNPYFVQPNVDPHYSHVSLLLHFNGASGSVFFPDSSVNRHPFSKQGTVHVSTTQSKFQGSSLRLDPSGGACWVEFPNHSSLMAESADFTAEAWVYVESFSTTNVMVIMGQENATATVGRWQLSIGNSGNSTYGGKLCIFIDGQYLISTTNTVPLNQWVHLAATRQSGSTLRLFINGVLEASGTLSTNLSAAIPFRVGGSTSGAGSFTGYLDEARFTKGLARYTSTFTVPTGPFPDSQAARDPHWNSVRFFAPFDRNFNSVVSGSTIDPNALTRTSPVLLETTAGAFGKGIRAGSQSGGDPYRWADWNFSPNLDLGTSSFCIEGWIKTYGVATGGSIRAIRMYGGAGDVLDAWFDPNGFSFTFIGTDGNFTLSASVPQNVTRYLVITRNGSNATLYLDGMAISTSSSAGVNIRSAHGLRIGTVDGNSGAIVLDDFKITLGTPRYLTGFRPPVNPLPQEAHDGYISTTVSVFNFEGPHGSTDYLADRGINAISPRTGADLPFISTTDKRFGASSLRLPTINSRLEIPLNVSTSGKFHIEFSFKLDSLPGTTQGIFGLETSGGLSACLFIFGDNSFQFRVNGTEGSPTALAAAVNTWYDVVIDCNGDSLNNGQTNIYVNGFRTNFMGFVLNNTYSRLVFGQNPFVTSNGFVGYLDNVRFTNGINRGLTTQSGLLPF